MWETLTQHCDRTTHAWLFKGPQGVGKTATAIKFALHLLSEGVADRAKVHALFSAGSHPDIHVLMPEQRCVEGEGMLEQYAVRYVGAGKGKPKSVISVDQIRLLIERVSTRSHTGANKCVIILPAECMNPNSANALLKILEEPPTRTLFLLISAMPHRLPATIISRCSPVDLREPDKDTARRWLLDQGLPEVDVDVLLALSGGAPLRAMRLHQTGFLEHRREWMSDVLQLMEDHQDPLEVAAKWNRTDRPLAMDWLHRFVMDLARIVFCEHPENLYNPDARMRLQDLKKRINVTALFDLFDRLGQGKQLLDSPVDQNLIMEDVLIRLKNIGLNLQQ
jgi:DNA polymerase-3 subunit delta'